MDDGLTDGRRMPLQDVEPPRTLYRTANNTFSSSLGVAVVTRCKGKA